MKKTFFILPLALIVSSLASAQGTPQSENTPRESADQPERQITQVNRDFDEAERKRDFAAIERMLADGFMWTTSAGTVFDRAGTGKHLRSGDSQYELYQSDDVRVRIYGDAAVTTARLTRRGQNSKRDLSGEFRYMRVYLKQSGNWRMVAYQVTSIAPAAAVDPPNPGEMPRPNSPSSPGAQTSGPTDSDSGPEVQAVLARTDELNQAFLHSDVATLDRIIADECLQITQNGARTKAEWLAPHRSGASRFESIKPPEWRRIRLYGDVAVVTSAADIVMTVQGERRASPASRFLNTRTWVKRSGQWYLVLAQNTARQEPAPAPAGANNASVPGQTSTTNDEATIRKIGILATGGRLIEGSPTLEAFKQGMRELGYAEGQNIILELRNTAAELISLNVDVIVAAGTPLAAIAKKSTSTIPIVYMGGDPVDNGLATSRERPGENITGVTVSPDLQLKHLQLLRQIVPGLKRVAVVFDPTYLAVPGTLKQTETAARSLGLELRPIEVPDPKGLDRAFSEVSRERVGAMMVLISPKLYREKEKIVEFAVKSQLPMTTPYRQYAEAGALISLGVDDLYWSRRLATYVDKILKGAKAGDLAIEQSTKLDFVINLKTAKVLGLTIPQSIVERADQVIQ